MKDINTLFQKKYFLIAIALFLLSFVCQFLIIVFDSSGWASLLMMPFIALHTLFLILFVILYKIKYRIAFLFPALVIIDGIMFIADMETIPSYLFFSLINNFLN